MSKNYARNLVSLLLGLFSIQSSFAQSTSSTYSSLGIGEFNNSGLTQNQAMGGMGISYGSSFSVNNVNPAISIKNYAYSFQAALNYNTLDAATSTSSDRVDGGGLSYVTMSFPLIPRKWSMGLGLNQVTGVDYNLSYLGPVVNSDLLSRNNIQGRGGLSEVYLQTGFQVVKNLSLGIHGSYLFGSTIRTNQLELLNPESLPIGISSEYYERMTFSDLTFKGGLYYMAKIGDRKVLNLGAIYHLFGDINGKEFAKMAELGQSAIPNSPGNVLRDDEPGSIHIPQRFGYGVSYEKVDKFVVGLEMQHQDFSQFRGFNPGESSLTNSFKVSLGGQYVPNPYSIESLFDRITFRSGVEFEKLPYFINDTEINDIGINFGASIPVYSMSLLNLAVKVGTRGTVDNGLIRENYFKVSLGISINDNSWFYKKVFE
ncbi:putative outer membrane protein [Lunatimonas lonarensis]|uniref:Putative outer membrane protein n=1 Tax=Lunatimonas lonarensis TaxID=1232681 RepID=R7ZYY0_9BACT|nr:outer membrane protein [Lunatimonas lonarensis]EON79295.1 putative outer membrane protein [Lunatimonas lonarensis]